MLKWMNTAQGDPARHTRAHRIAFVPMLAALCLVGCAVPATSSAPPTPTPRLRVGLEPVAEGFTTPVTLVTPGDGSGRLFVVDQVGVIRVIANGTLLDEPFLDIHDRIVELSESYDERGLLGLAFHPAFAKNGRFFVYYSAPPHEGLSAGEWDHTTRVSEFAVSQDNPNRADPESERIVLAVDKPGYNYEAGQIAFGPDSYLYIAMGDSARHPDEEIGGHAQDTSSLLGKILRIDVDAGDPYGIPPNNPFAAGGGRAEVFAYGFRNPYRFSFDTRGEHTLFVGDVGHALMEEVDIVTRSGNYGWPIREGTTCFNRSNWTRPLDTCATSGSSGEALIDPVIVYRHSDGLSAVIGGMVYRGRALPDLRGYYLFGDWGRGQGRLFAARPPKSGTGPWAVEAIAIAYRNSQPELGQLLGFGQDADRELYILAKDPRSGPTGHSGWVYRIARP